GLALFPRHERHGSAGSAWRPTAGMVLGPRRRGGFLRPGRHRPDDTVASAAQLIGTPFHPPRDRSLVAQAMKAITFDISMPRIAAAKILGVASPRAFVSSWAPVR